MADDPRSWREVGRVFRLIILAVIVAVCYNALTQTAGFLIRSKARFISPRMVGKSVNMFSAR